MSKTRRKKRARFFCVTVKWFRYIKQHTVSSAKLVYFSSCCYEDGDLDLYAHTLLFRLLWSQWIWNEKYTKMRYARKWNGSEKTNGRTHSQSKRCFTCFVLADTSFFPSDAVNREENSLFFKNRWKFGLRAPLCKIYLPINAHNVEWAVFSRITKSCILLTIPFWSAFCPYSK